MLLTTILDQIDMGSIALPEFQRGYVWNRDQVRKLMTSLYRSHPVGSLLVWETQTEHVTDHARGSGNMSAGTVKLLLDGQQRITSLYGIIRGKAPKFFDGNTNTFNGLYFHLENENFAFYMPTRMDGNPLWINVTKLMIDGVGSFLQPFISNTARLNDYINRLSTIENVKKRDFHIEEVTGPDKTIDEVVDIFNNVNSGGTKLSKGDLALARICAPWPEAREELKSRLNKWEQAGFNFKIDWLLRCITTVTANDALFSALKDVSTDRFKKGLCDTERSIDTVLNIIASRLGLDHNRVLGGVYAMPIMARYLDQRGGHLNHQERDQILYWYVHTLLWGRYSGSVESVLRQDLAAIDSSAGSLTKLIELLRQNRGNLRITPNDFGGSTKGNRFYPMLYMLTRVHGARDWADDINLSQHLLGKLACLEVHHIFPKSKLYAHGYSKSEVNAIANFTFLTKETNLQVSNRDPQEYFAHYEAQHPGSIASHWIPTDPELWRYENYQNFLAARQQLLAQATNEFLDSLYAGAVPEPHTLNSLLERGSVPGSMTDDSEEKILHDCNQWVVEQQLPSGDLAHNLTSDTNDILAILDLAWPRGLQPGYSQPVAILLNETSSTETMIQNAGFRTFTNVEKFKIYVQQNVLALHDMSTPG